jgi:hypothetical protein
MAINWRDDSTKPGRKPRIPIAPNLRKSAKTKGKTRFAEAGQLRQIPAEPINRIIKEPSP